MQPDTASTVDLVTNKPCIQDLKNIAVLPLRFVLSDTNSRRNSYRRAYANHQTLLTVQEFFNCLSPRKFMYTVFSLWN